MPKLFIDQISYSNKTWLRNTKTDRVLIVSEAYSKPFQTSRIKPFGKMINSLWAVNYFYKKTFILDVWWGSEYTFEFDYVKSVQIRARKTSLFGHFSRGGHHFLALCMKKKSKITNVSPYFQQIFFIKCVK